MIETLQTLKEFQRTSGRVLINPDWEQVTRKVQAPDLMPLPKDEGSKATCPTCLANKAKALARVKAHRARRRTTDK